MKIIFINTCNIFHSIFFCNQITNLQNASLVMVYHDIQNKIVITWIVTEMTIVKYIGRIQQHIICSTITERLHAYCGSPLINGLRTLISLVSRLTISGLRSHNWPLHSQWINHQWFKIYYCDRTWSQDSLFDRYSPYSNVSVFSFD